jgi:hypothetical protein
MDAIMIQRRKSSGRNMQIPGNGSSSTKNCKTGLRPKNGIQQCFGCVAQVSNYLMQIMPLPAKRNLILKHSDSRDRQDLSVVSIVAHFRHELMAHLLQLCCR